MKVFGPREIREALAHSAMGHQALHRHRFLGARPPACFRRDVDRGLYIGHLFDWNRERLEGTARHLGVRRVVVEDIGRPRQHVDLCGAPMRAAEEFCASCRQRGLFEFAPPAQPDPGGDRALIRQMPGDRRTVEVLDARPGWAGKRCACGAPARTRSVLLLEAFGRRGRLELQVEVCDACAAAVDPDKLISPEGWQAIERAWTEMGGRP